LIRSTVEARPNPTKARFHLRFWGCDQRVSEVSQMEGTIKWFNNSKGYGFIGLENGLDVFVHYTGIVGDGYRTLREGDRVSFELVQGPKGPQAANVVKVGESK
jgi:CspA family cold shock protein